VRLALGLYPAPCDECDAFGGDFVSVASRLICHACARRVGDLAERLRHVMRQRERTAPPAVVALPEDTEITAGD